jgi:hypothetical protein
VKTKGVKSFYGAGNSGKADVGNNLKKLPSSTPKTPKEAHTDHTKYGMGDYYGTSHKNPMGKMRDVSVGFRPVNKKQLKTPPRGVV